MINKSGIRGLLRAVRVTRNPLRFQPTSTTLRGRHGYHHNPLLAVAAMAVLLIAGILAVVVDKTRTQGETIRDQAEKNRATFGIKKHSPTGTPEDPRCPGRGRRQTVRARRLPQQAAAAATNREPTGATAVHAAG